jgi:hypothetical protein
MDGGEKKNREGGRGGGREGGREGGKGYLQGRELLELLLGAHQLNLELLKKIKGLGTSRRLSYIRVS